MVELKDFVSNIEKENNYTYIVITKPNEIRVVYKSPFAQNDTRCATFVPDDDTAYLVEIHNCTMTVDEHIFNMFETGNIVYHSNLIKELCRRSNDEEEKEN